MPGESTRGPNPKPDLKLVKGSATSYTPPPDILPGVLPGGDISLLFGASLVGKTALYTEWIQRILDGKSILGLDALKPPKVGIVFTDRPWHMSQYWPVRAGIAERVSRYCLKDDEEVKWAMFRSSANHPKLFAMALDKLGDMPPGSFVIVDALSPYLGTKLNDYSSTAAAIGPISQICRERKLTILGVHHTGKVKGDPRDRYLKAQDKVLGSTALTAYTNTQFYVLGPEDTGRNWYVVGYATHNAPSREFKFMKDSEGRFIPYASTKKIMDSSVPLTQLMSMELDRLIGQIPTEPPGTPTGALIQYGVKNLEMSGITVKRRLSMMKERGLITNHEGKWIVAKPVEKSDTAPEQPEG